MRVKKSAIILLFTLVLLCCLSVLNVYTLLHHDCQGEECEVCSIIKHLLRELGSLGALLSILLFCGAITMINKAIRPYYVSFLDTPITLCVKLTS